jgi:putative ABC transport system permease protein
MVTSPRTQSSATFIGIGVFPSEDKRLAHWNPYGITPAESIAANAPFFAGLPELDDSDIAGASVGSGLAHILRLDEKPGEALLATAEGSAAAKDDGGVDLGFLASQSGPRDEDAGGKPSLDLLVAPPSGGMPNAASVSLRKIVPGTTKELADRMIKLHAKHASQMLFPNQPLHVTALVVLLKRTEDTQAVLERLKVLFERDKLDLECRPWEEIRPVYPRMKKMVGLIFSFMFVLLTVMVAFLIYNTQAAGIMERLAEVGTLRAMGLTRLSLWRLLVLEGLVLGVIGGVLGIALAIAGDIGFNAANITYIPPSVSFYAKLEVLVLRDPIVLLQSFAGTLLCALASSAIPARRAARMEIVEALRHS